MPFAGLGIDTAAALIDSMDNSVDHDFDTKKGGLRKSQPLDLQQAYFSLKYIFSALSVRPNKLCDWLYPILFTPPPYQKSFNY